MEITQIQQSVYELFRVALNIQEPWKLTTFEFNEQQEQWNLFVDYHRGAKFACTWCGDLCEAYDAHNRTWRHLDLLQWKTFIHVLLPRYYCQNCKMEKFLMVPKWSCLQTRID